MKIAAIPTKYKGIQFRSRLEARWASFFDLCRWYWKYEPFDLPGWIPDFAIYPYVGSHSDDAWNWKPDLSRPILVEIKPITSLCDATIEKIGVAAASWLSANRAPTGEVWLLGNGPMEGRSSWFRQLGWRIGAFWLSDFRRDDPKSVTNPKHWHELYAFQYYGPNGLLDGEPLSEFVTVNGSEGCDLLVGQTTCISLISESSSSVVDDLWNAAGNDVQWKAAR